MTPLEINQVQELGRQALIAERERCAVVADDLASRWEASAAKWREQYTVRPLFFGKPYVLPARERDAKAIDAGVAGLRAVAMVIRQLGSK